MVFKSIKKGFSKIMSSDSGNEYVEIDANSQEAPKQKVMIKLFTLRTYEDVNNILNVLREGYTIAMIDIKVLRSKDVIELKRSIAKIKKTVDALEGNIAGFGENTLIVTPAFAVIEKEESNMPREQKKNFETY